MSDVALLMSSLGLNQLKSDEGFRPVVYNDATGLALHKWDLSPAGNATIGYGLNLMAGITADEAEYLLTNRLLTNELRLERVWPEFASWPQVQLDVALMIDYNTGDLTKWSGFVNAVRSRMPADLIVRNIVASDAWRSGLTHARYQRFCDAITRGFWLC